MPTRSSSACSVPSSPEPPWRARNATSMPSSSGARSSDATSPVRSTSSSARPGGSGDTPASSSRASSSPCSTPRAVSTAMTSCPRERSAFTTCAPLAMDTSRSSLVPPKRTAIFIPPPFRGPAPVATPQNDHPARPADPARSWIRERLPRRCREERARSLLGQVPYHVIARDDASQLATRGDQHCRVLPRQHACDAPHRRGRAGAAPGLTPPLLDTPVEHARILDDTRHERRFGEAADAATVVADGQLGDVVRVDQRKRLAQLRVRLDRDERGRRALLALDHLLGAQPLRLEQPVLAQPFLVVDLAEVALAGVRQHAYDERIRIVHLLRDLHRERRDQAGAAADEESLLARQ